MATPAPLGLIAGGTEAEHRISLLSGQSLLRAASALGRVVHPVLIGIDGRWSALPPVHPGQALDWPESVATLHPAAVVPSGEPLAVAAHWKALGVKTVLMGMHGRGGEDGSLQGFLEVAGFAFTGSGVRASAWAIDKHRCKQILESTGLPTPRGRLVLAADLAADFEGERQRIEDAIGTPAVFKALDLGSSVSVVPLADAAALRAQLESPEAKAADFLIEEWIKGPEYTVPVFGRAAHAQALPVIEIRPRHAAWFDYASKYEQGGADEIVPAPISAELARQLSDLACRAHRALAAGGVSRTDFMNDPVRGPLIIEVNTLPGMTQQSLVPKSARAAGWSETDLVERLIDDANGA